MKTANQTTPDTTQKSTTTNLKKPIFALLIATVFIIPIAFVPLTTDAISFNKQTLFLVLILTILILWFGNAALKKKIQFSTTPLDIPLILLIIANIAATALAPNRITTATTLWTWVWVFLPTFYWAVINNVESEKQIKIMQKIVLLNAGLLALWSVLQYIFGFNLNIIGISANRAFSPFGNTELLSIYLLTAGGIAAGNILTQLCSKNKTKNMNRLILLSAVLILLIIAVLLVSPWTTKFFTKITNIGLPRPAKLNIRTAWSVASETIRNKPIAGAGTGMFDTAFHQFKPLSFNRSEFWNLNFKQSHNLWLQTLTEKGLLGIIAIIILVQAVVKNVLKNLTQREKGTERNLSLVIPIIILIISSFFTTWNTALALTLFLLIALYQKELTLKTSTKEVAVGNLPAKATFLLILLLGLPGYYLLGRNYLAENLYQKALKTSFNNQVVASYDYLGKAINYHPYNVQYRITYSNINYLIALNLSSAEEISTNDRNIAQKLISQAIREARIATIIKPQSHSVWTNLGSLYKNLVGAVDGVETWALESYNKAINRNPIDPRIHIQKGGVYYRTGNYQKAAEEFITAINLKQDYANSYYNLANALKEAGNTKKALQAYQLTLILLEENSTDYKIVESEIENMKQTGVEQPEKTSETEQLELSGSDNENTEKLENIQIDKEQIEAPNEATQSGLLE